MDYAERLEAALYRLRPALFGVVGEVFSTEITPLSVEDESGAGDVADAT
ncbi:MULTISPECIES: hypothetical protein [unclassified Streptomyces]